MKQHEVIIQANRPERHYWRDLWRNRELLYILSMRDISIRYKQTALGASWSLIRPLTTMLIMVFVFSIIAKLPADPGIPYPLMVVSGLTVWTFFANAFTQISSSITANTNLVTKVYFPRLIMPLSAVAVSFIDFLISLGLFVIIAIWYQFVPDWHILWLPAFMLLALLAALAFGLFFAVVNVRFRDIAQLIPFIIQVGFYICPIAYSSRLVAGQTWHGIDVASIYTLNPLVGIIEGFRWALLGGKSYFDPNSVVLSAVVVLVTLVFSVYFFRKRENTFVDDI